LRVSKKSLSSKLVARTFVLALFGLIVLVTGCGKSATQVPMVPERTADHETHAPRRERRPHLIAPPPAYGNKVVMAKSGERAALN
jgi:hypothetical protein